MASHSRKSLTGLRVGGRVQYTVLVNNTKKRLTGVLAYGPGPFHVKPNEHDWCGVVLDEAAGKNNGTIQGKQYFECPDNYGVMVRASSLRPLPDGSSRIPHPGQLPRSRSTTPSSTPSMTPSSSIASFTGMFDSGQAGKETSPKSAAMSESLNVPSHVPSAISRLKPPTKIMSISSQDVSNSQIPKPSSIPGSGGGGGKDSANNIRQMVEKIETKCDEKIREESDTQDISQKLISQSSVDSVASREINEANDKIKDLESKLATLMAVRAQDKLKFKELERLKIQNEQLLENKRQMAEKVAELSKLKATAEKVAQEAKEEQQRQSDEIKDLIDNAEMAVIDKEMAENKAEQLQIELEQVKEQLEEAKIDFELLKSEIEDKGADGAANSFQVKQLEEQNVRYKEALLKFRDISATDRNNIQLLQKELESKSEEIAQLLQLKDKNSSEIEKFRESINELTEQVDMALGSQEMVEKLTEKKLELEDKVEELQKALDEEENIKDLSNMIIEEKDEIIADLRDEVDRYKTNLVNLRNSYIVMQEAVNDHECTIKKFRELVAALREENGLLRAAQAQDHSKVQQAVDVQKQLEHIEFKTRLLDRRDLSRAIDMELRQLDVDQCYRYMIYLTRFFPETFFARGADHDAIAVLMFVPRIFAKCAIVERQILDKYAAEKEAASSETIVRDAFAGEHTLRGESFDKLKQQIFCKHMLYLLCSIRSVLDKYQDVLSRCDAELFMKLGALFPELAPYEKRIDHYVDLLRHDKLDETVTLDSLEETLIYLQSLFNIHLASCNMSDAPAGENHCKFLNDLLDVFRTGTEASILDIKILSQVVASDASMAMTSLETTLNDIDQFCRKIRRRMVSAGSGSSDCNPACMVRFPGSVEAELFDSVRNLTFTARCLKTIRAAMLLQFVNQPMPSADSGGSPASADQEIGKISYFSLEELNKTCRELTANSVKELGEMLGNVMSAVSKLSTSLQQGDFDVAKSVGDSGDSFNSLSSAASSLPNCTSLQSIQCLFSSSNSLSKNKTALQSMTCLPLDERALKWRAQSDQIGEFRVKITKQETDIGELKRALKTKIDEVSEMQIRKDIAEKKLSSAQKEYANLQHELERQAKEFHEKEAEKEKALNKYNQEINELYSDHRMMKEKLKDYSKNAMMAGKMMPGTPLGGSPNVSLSGAMQSPLSANNNNNNNLSINMSALSSTPTGPASASSLSFNTANSTLQSLHYLSSSPASTLVCGGGGGSGSGSLGIAANGDIAELQQQIFNLRSAMKRMAKRNYDLRILLAESSSSGGGEPTTTSNDAIDERHLPSAKPRWYVDTLRRCGGSKFENDQRERRIDEMRHKLIDFKYDLLRSRCESSLLPPLDSIAKNKPGWTRHLSDLIRKGAQRESLHEIELARRYRELRAQVEDFIKSFEDGYSCDSSYASFLAPHISKAIESKRKLVARITVPAGSDTNASVIPIEVTLAELKSISASLMY